MKIALINHGCPKNLVDAELMLGYLAENGYEITLDDTKADVVIVNTCSFIHDAEKESVDTILELAQRGKKIIVTGCLSQKHRHELKEAIPEISAMLGTTDFKEILEVLKSDEYKECISKIPEYTYPEQISRQQITVGASSFIKIADGCNYNCGYCIIPKLRGKYVSRKIEDIVNEAKSMVEKGVSEIVLIAQDTTYYGIDLYNKPMLAELLKRLNDIEDLTWIRIMYTHPSMMTDELLETIAKLDKVVKYIDIPLQHSHPRVLKAMNRPVEDYEKLVKRIREKIPNVTVRTTLITGYPTETDEEFEHLYNFVEKVRFDRMGAFTYSREKGTDSYSLKPQIKKSVKLARQKRLMLLQQRISKEINETFIGKTIPCMVEYMTDDGVAIARSQRDAAEIDGQVYISTDRELIPGDIEQVKITSVDEYDLYGEV